MPKVEGYGLGGGGGGGFSGGAGIPAAIMPQPGLTAAQKQNEEWRGVLVGIGRADAGIDWTFETVAGTEAVQAHTTITSGGSTLRIDLDAGLAGASGALGNRWQVDVNPANLSSDPSSARISRANVNQPVVLIVVRQGGSNFTQIAAIVNAIAGLSATVTGPGGTAFPSSIARQSFAGGADADELGVEYDMTTKTVTMEHLRGHTQAEIVTFLTERQLDNETTLYATLIAGSNGAAAPEAAPQSYPFSRIYSTGSLPKPSTEDIDALRSQISGLTFADIQGEVADGQIPGLIARDSEVASEVASAVSNLRNGVKAAYDTLKELADKVVTGVAVRNGRIVLTHDDGTETSADATGLARTDTQINALIRAALQAAVSGNTESGIVVTYNSDGTLDFTVTATGGGGGGASVAQTLAAILAGTGISIDRSQSGQITISATGSGPAPAADHFRFGLSADRTPVAGEATIQANNGEGELAAFSNMYILIFRLVSEDDITSVTFSDDPSMDNEVGAFTKHGSTVTVSGSAYNVWVSNQALTHANAVTMTVR